MADNTGAPIVIKRINKGGHGHHGGAWKVAYADFVTAMMAFFLLLWLLNVTTEEQKNGIADYFTPSTASDSVASGAGNVLGGASITVPGSSVSENSPVSVADPVATTGVSMTQVDEEAAASADDGEEANSQPNTQPNTEQNTQPNTDPNAQQVQPTKPTEDQINKAIVERENRMFEQAAEELRQAIQKSPELAELQKSLIIDQTPEGLRIQLVDQEGYSMFPRGSAVLQGRTKQLLDLVARAVTSLPNKISISGHTDSTPYLNPNGTYSNWELSSDRANAARRELLGGGIEIDRLATVVGRADREPYIKDAPEDPRNRRLSIILLRQSLTGTPAEVDPTLTTGPAINADGTSGTGAPAPTTPPPPSGTH